MAYLILRVRAHLGKRAGPSDRDENRIVAEAAASPLNTRDASCDASTKKVNACRIDRRNCHGTMKDRGPIRLSLHLAQNFSAVRAVIRRRASVPRRPETGTPPQRRDLEP